MRTLTLLVALASCALAGCAGTTRTVGPGELADVRAALAGRSATVVLVDGARYPADALRLDPDTTSWVDPATGDLVLVATPFVAEVERRDRARSALRTAGAGALASLVAGAVVGAALCADLGCRSDTAVISLGVGVALAPGGALWGGVGGALANRPDRWQFVRPGDAGATGG